ncbi:unnamed protein product, partial [Durusdinium trenchii]
EEEEEQEKKKPPTTEKGQEKGGKEKTNKKDDRKNDRKEKGGKDDGQGGKEKKDGKDEGKDSKEKGGKEVGKDGKEKGKDVKEKCGKGDAKGAKKAKKEKAMKEEANKVSKEDKKDSSEEKKAKKAKKSDGKTKTDESSSKAKGRKADAMGEVGADAEKKPRTEKRGKKREAEDEGTKSKLAEAEKRTINSSTHHKEWQAYKRWIKNKKRFPASLATRVQSEEGRNSLFKDYVENEGDTAKITAKHLQSLEEKSSNECRYGFRSEKWIHDQHGTDKGNKIIQRKKEQGLYVEDPECPGENLWFVLISLDVSNVQQFKKITSMEISGAASPEVLKAFTDQGGVLSGEGLKGATTSDGAMKKAVGFMQTACGGSGKKPRKPKGGDNKEEDGKGGEKVVAKTWEEKAGALITKILRDANTCRDNAFKLKPLEMSSELIKHLKAVEIQLQRAASKLQDLVNKGCKKGKHYQPIVDEVDQLTQLAKEKIQLAKALVRAAENAKKTDKKEVKENEKTEKPTAGERKSKGASKTKK